MWMMWTLRLSIPPVICAPTWQAVGGQTLSEGPWMDVFAAQRYLSRQQEWEESLGEASSTCQARSERLFRTFKSMSLASREWRGG